MNTDDYLYILIYKKELLVSRQTKLPLLLTHSQINHLKNDITLDFCVGTYQSIHYQVVELINLEALDQSYLTQNLRQLLGQVGEGMWWVLSRGMQLIEWYYSNQFCSRCGTKTEQSASEYSFVCMTCQYVQYPRINPCIMVLITDGDKILLTKSSRDNVTHYSLVAGYVEAGEDAEEAARREVSEEVGLQINDLKYICSQSWPFPHSLMLGFTAKYHDGQLFLDPTEISEAQWVSRVAINSIKLPDEGTLSLKLINGWLEGDYQ